MQPNMKTNEPIEKNNFKWVFNCGSTITAKLKGNQVMQQLTNQSRKQNIKENWQFAAKLFLKRAHGFWI